MNPEMILRYLYYMTHMTSGNSKLWGPCYNAWHNFSNNTSTDDYEKILDALSKFNKKHLIKKK
jgi:hypothetical protein